MSMRINYSDQTLSVAALSHVPKTKLILMGELLQRIGISTIDIPIEQAKIYGFSQGLINNAFRAVIKPVVRDVDTAYRLGFQRISVPYHHKTGELSNVVYELLEKARRLNVDCSLEIENASSFPVSELAAVINSLKDQQLDTVIYGDRYSLMEPLRTYNILKHVRQLTEFNVEFHAHDGYHLATANTLSAIKAGVRHVATSVTGVGNAKHAPFEEVVLAARHLCSLSDNIAAQDFAAECAIIATYLGKEIPVDKAIIGKNIFAHESGLHVHGVMKNPSIYEAFPPEEVGLSRFLIIGKHSGSAALQAALSKLGIEPSTAELQKLLKSVRTIVSHKKSHLTPYELLHLYNRREGGSYEASQ